MKLTKQLAVVALLVGAFSLSACSTTSPDPGTAGDAGTTGTTGTSTDTGTAGEVVVEEEEVDSEGSGTPQTVEQACAIIEQGQNDLATVNQATSLEEVAERLDAITAKVTNPQVFEPWNGYVTSMHALMALAVEMGEDDSEIPSDDQSETEATLFNDVMFYEGQLDELCDFDWD